MSSATPSSRTPRSGLKNLAMLVAILALVAGAPAVVAQDAPPADQGDQADQADQKDRLEALEAEVARLKAELEALKESHDEGGEEAASAGQADQADQIGELERRVDILAAEIERLRLGEAAAEASGSERGLGPAASKIYRTARGLSIGGYGEMLYQGFAGSRDDGVPSDATDELDFVRAIVYFGYKFNDHFLFNSELEVEHAVTGEDAEGEAAIEFAYLDYLYRPALNLRAGLVLIPMGFLNELHEPTVYLGARRPDVERVILPTTWRENGFGLFGDVGPFTYRTYVVGGLDASGFAADNGLREGRQEGSETKVEDFAWVGRLDYTGTPGLLLGASAYFGDSGQDLRTPEGRRLGVGTTLYEGHLEWRFRGFELRALGVRAELDDVAELDRALGLTGSESIGEELQGYYVQLAYDLLARRGSGERALLPYVRWESYDTQSKVPAGFARNPANDVESLTVGLAFKPIDQIILKADYQNYDNGAGSGLDQLNVALGYIF